MEVASPPEPSIQQRVVAALGDDTFERALYAHEQRSLADSETRWRTFDAIHELPDEPLGGWERLLVFTSDYVYTWTETGYSRGPQRTPRHPDISLLDC